MELELCMTAKVGIGNVRLTDALDILRAASACQALSAMLISIAIQSISNALQ